MNQEYSEQVREIMQASCKKIAPVWPLENFVAVNPYMGFTNKNFSEAATELARIADIELTMPVSFYKEKIQQGKISLQNLSEVLAEHGQEKDAEEFLSDISKAVDFQSHRNVDSVTDLASSISATDWNRFMISRISAWASSYFDRGQAYWKSSFSKVGIFASWKAEAQVDYSMDLNGLKLFRKRIADLPEDHQQATMQALEILNIKNSAHLAVYFHRLLRMVAGWSAYIAYLDWEEQLAGKQGGHLMEFLSILICWEAGLIQSMKDPQLADLWSRNKRKMFNELDPSAVSKELVQTLILQEAYDRSTQQEMIKKFTRKEPIAKQPKTSKAQAIFCIDVRSEIFRRNLEQVDPQIETLGFAGFFGFPIDFVSLGHEHAESQCPVLLKPAVTVTEELGQEEATMQAISRKKLQREMKYIWKSFKSGAITCFSFVSPIGLSFLPKLFSDSFGWTRPVSDPKDTGLSKIQIMQKKISVKEGKPGFGIPFAQQVQMAGGALKAMSITDNFARIVLLVGHGSTSVNNPHATGLDCGACGGKSGEANARVAATILNDLQVREALKKEGIDIPEETIFLACLHDTTVDEVAIFNEQDVPASRLAELNELKASLKGAGTLSRTERAVRMGVSTGNNADQAIFKRGKDWSQVRPEWGLAGCSAFVVGPRELTSAINLEGKSFLHSYKWKQDKDFAVLEQIMTAPMVVTSWINLQYYASAVDNQNMGSGNKTLHNVTAGLGVIEGSTGDLRQGLPWQSVHDGQQFQHDPLRLTVVIAAPKEAINEVIKKQESVRNLFDNQWISLLLMDDDGAITHRYQKNLSWKALNVLEKAS